MRELQTPALPRVKSRCYILGQIENIRNYLKSCALDFKEGLRDPAVAMQIGRLQALTDVLNDPEIIFPNF